MTGRWIFGFTVLILIGAQADAGLIQSSFTNGTEGWRGNGGPVSWVSSGGNPGGYLDQTDTNGGTMFVVAPGKFLGDLSSFNGGQLSWTATETQAGSGAAVFGIVRLFSGASILSLDMVASTTEPPSGSWNGYSASLDYVTWGAASQAAWITHLSNITRIEVVLEHDPTITEATGFDTFQITPEPSSLLLLGLGALGLAGYGARRRRRAKRT